MWNSGNHQKENYSEYLREFIPDNTSKVDYFPTFEEFIEIIKYPLNWKAAGIDGVYNFTIKKCASLHASLYRLTRKTCIEKEESEEWL